MSVRCRHDRPECECLTRLPGDSHAQPLSSGRWDASGSWVDAVYEEREKAFTWAKNLSLKELHWALTVMASEVNAFTLYERSAILEVASLEIFDKWVKEMND
jgi:hypothetical protein